MLYSLLTTTLIIILIAVIVFSLLGSYILWKLIQKEAHIRELKRPNFQRQAIFCMIHSIEKHDIDIHSPGFLSALNELKKTFSEEPSIVLLSEEDEDAMEIIAERLINLPNYVKLQIFTTAEQIALANFHRTIHKLYENPDEAIA